MAEFNLGRVKGSTWYAGAMITGISAEPVKFTDSGIGYACVLDKYLNQSNLVDNGNVYECVTPGNPDAAEWVYIGSIKGSQPSLVNNLESESITSALAARMGKELNDKINNAGIYPYAIKISATEDVGIVNLTIENKTTDITVRSKDGKEYTLSYIKEYESTSIYADITITLSSTILGVTKLDSIESTDAVLVRVELKNGTEVLEENDLNIWDELNKLIGHIDVTSSFTDGQKTYNMAQVKAPVAGKLTNVYPASHVKAIYWDLTAKKTLHEYLNELNVSIDSKFSAVNQTITGNKTDVDNEITNIKSLLTTQDGKISDNATNIDKLNTAVSTAQETAEAVNQRIDDYLDFSKYDLLAVADFRVDPQRKKTITKTLNFRWREKEENPYMGYLFVIWRDFNEENFRLQRATGVIMGSTLVPVDLLRFCELYNVSCQKPEDQGENMIGQSVGIKSSQTTPYDIVFSSEAIKAERAYEISPCLMFGIRK